MSRVIQSETGRKERDRWLKAIVKALRLLMMEQEPGQVSFDLTAFIILALYQVYETIDSSVSAWEKRGYWLKADRYRLEWEWCGYYAKDMHKAILEEDWNQIISIVIKIGQKLNHIKLPQRDRIGTPWIGSWEQLQKNPLSVD